MKVCDNLRWYIHDRVTHNPAWKNLTVILSDGSVPGEGEHKVMDFIRRERGQPGYNPNTTYVFPASHSAVTSSTVWMRI